MIGITRYHDISCGHRVVGHESKCRGLHGHNYRITFTCSADALDTIGRVIDFSVMKARLCMWLENEWDHKMLLWEQDPLAKVLTHNIPNWIVNMSELMKRLPISEADEIKASVGSVVVVPFNPTAENMADYLLKVVGPQQLDGTGVQLVAVRVEETRKCSAVVALN